MQAWEQFLKLQENVLGVEPVKKWLRTLKILRFDACNLYLEAADSFQALWFEEHARSLVQKNFVNGNQKKINIHLTVEASQDVKKLSKSSKEKAQKKTYTPTFHLTFDELNPIYLFENYLSKDNLLTYQLLTEITGYTKLKNHTTPLGAFNPIYIYGNTGSGKTHLLMSTAHVLKKQGLKTIYVRAETFTNHVVNAIRAGEMSLFRQAYRNIDVLLIDDVHIFSRKGATQEEFFHTFNTLQLEGKQIILTANASPLELQLIEPRLISRFEWGIVLPLKQMAKEEMGQILESKVRALNFFISPEIMEFLSETFTSNPKMLTRAFEALILRSHLDKPQSAFSLTVEGVKSLLADLIAEEYQATLTFDKIIQAIADHYGIRPEDILSKAQKRDCSLPRQLAMYLCRQQLKMPFMKIGEVLTRNHSTVISGIKQIQIAIDQNNRDITENYFTILKKLTA